MSFANPEDVAPEEPCLSHLEPQVQAAVFMESSPIELREGLYLGVKDEI